MPRPSSRTSSGSRTRPRTALSRLHLRHRINRGPGPHDGRVLAHAARRLLPLGLARLDRLHRLTEGRRHLRRRLPAPRPGATGPSRSRASTRSACEEEPGLLAARRRGPAAPRTSTRSSYGRSPMRRSAWRACGRALSSLIQTDNPASVREHHERRTADAPADHRIVGHDARLQHPGATLDDVRGRRALAHGIDRQDIDDAVYGGESVPREVHSPSGRGTTPMSTGPSSTWSGPGELVANLKADGGGGHRHRHLHRHLGQRVPPSPRSGDRRSRSGSRSSPS